MSKRITATADYSSKEHAFSAATTEARHLMKAGYEDVHIALVAPLVAGLGETFMVRASKSFHVQPKEAR